MIILIVRRLIIATLTLHHYLHDLSVINVQAVSNVKKHYMEFCQEVGYYPHTSSVQAIWAIGGDIDEMGEGFDGEDMQNNSSTSARYLTGEDRKSVV